MNNKDKLEFLNKYTLTKGLTVDFLDIEDIEDNQIPETWRDIFREKEKKRKINKMLRIWEEYLGKELSNTIAYFREFLEDIELMKIGNRISVLYSVKSFQKGRILYYEGGNPKNIENKMPNELKINWNKLSEKIRGFYSFVHNGFYYYPSKSMGLDKIENVTHLDDYEWEVIEDLGISDVKLDLTTSYGFFSNGMGTYVVIDSDNCIDDTATLWSSKNEPKYDLNFWDVVDEWLVIGFD